MLGQNEQNKILSVYQQQKKKSFELKNSTFRERKEWLLGLRSEIVASRTQIQKALKEDFAKPQAETDLTEILPVLAGINHSLKHLEEWMSPKKAKTPWLYSGTKSWIRPEPKGMSLIISPWNYPFNLGVYPVVSALGAGNTVMIKPSEFTVNTNKVIQEIFEKLFSSDHVCLIEGEKETSEFLLNLKWDHVFFTGSTSVGRVVMKKAAEQLCTTTLELGGKSPAIIAPDADLKTSAERICWGKFLNAGQTCVAPDYVLIHPSQKEEWIGHLREAIERFYGSGQEKLDDLANIISPRHLDRLHSLLAEAQSLGAKLILGGKSIGQQLRPTLLDMSKPFGKIMEEEIFGPILPIISMDSLDSMLEWIRSQPRPLALYAFTESTSVREKILMETYSGGVMMNDVILHSATVEMPFGGTGESGMGAYHGEYGFWEFSHRRATMERVMEMGAKNLYPPYLPKKLKFLEMAFSNLKNFF